jgi:hypothetical protein
MSQTQEPSIRMLTNLCISSSDSSFVFGPVDSADWRMSTSGGGFIVGKADEKLLEAIRATAESHDPSVHVTCDCEGELYHGSGRICSIEPSLEIEIVGDLVRA